MKKSWFQHTQLTTEQADELEARYRAKQIKTWIMTSFTGRSARSCQKHLSLLARTEPGNNGSGGECESLRYHPNGQAQDGSR